MFEVEDWVSNRQALPWGQGCGDPPPCNSGILGILKDPNTNPTILIVTITGWGANLKDQGLGFEFCGHRA